MFTGCEVKRKVYDVILVNGCEYKFSCTSIVIILIKAILKKTQIENIKKVTKLKIKIQ